LSIDRHHVAQSRGTRPDATSKPKIDDQPFSSFFLGGFECSSHRRADGRRLDLLASTGHDHHALADYQVLKEHGIHAARDGIRWHQIERRQNHYDWSTALPMIRAAKDSGMQPIWDLCHYGIPDNLDIWSADFVRRFADFSAAFAALVQQEAVGTPIYCPINEISFWAWAGGDMARMHPLARHRGPELKRQLIRASIAAISAVREVDPLARFITAEPLIHVVPTSAAQRHKAAAQSFRMYQFEALDLLSGTLEPELGGDPSFIDIVGVNYYPDNQWYFKGPTIPLGHHAYRPLRDLLLETYMRYKRPLFIAETGAEESARSAWLHYVCEQVREAQQADVPIHGICLYPILDYPGWDNERLCKVGLLSMLDEAGQRQIHEPLARELRWQRHLFEAATGADPGTSPNRALA
jgi:beta-glucosidase/6-phospho-beta-glucosidase/beta-galactosidase